VSLRPLVLKSTHLLEPLAQAGKVSLLIDITPDLVVHADPKRLEQVLVNLVSNAIKYNREDGWVKVMARRDPNDQVRISVSDNGRGISPADQALIFKPFERGSAENTGVPGTGLGLSLTKKFVELMQGEIGFDSVPQQGSTFWFMLSHGPSGSAKRER
jgi:signal transduction histidine kinase